MSGKKRSATRAQFCATRAQFCATRAQFQKVSVSEIDSNTFRSFYGLDMLGVRTPNIFGGNHLTVHVESEKICIEQHFNSSILIVSPFMSDTRLASCQTLVSGADMLGQRTNGPQDVKPADIDELIRATKLKHKMMMHELKWFYILYILACPAHLKSPSLPQSLLQVQQEKLAALRKELQECGEPPEESEVEMVEGGSVMDI